MANKSPCYSCVLKNEPCDYMDDSKLPLLCPSIEHTLGDECIHYIPSLEQVRKQHKSDLLNGVMDGLYQKANDAIYEYAKSQTAKADQGKLQLTLVPRQIIYDIAEIRMYGNRKYHDPENWKDVEKERYRDAAFRHFLAYLDDPQGVDEESGLSHLSHLACNIAFLCEMEHNDSFDAKGVNGYESKETNN